MIERTYRATLEDVWDLWTTKEGFEAWWGPRGFRAEVHEIDARVGGLLRYDMIAATPEMVAVMQQMGQPTSRENRGRFKELQRHKRLVLGMIIDFIAGVGSYESEIEVDLAGGGEHVRMVVTLHGMHSEELTKMQEQGFTSQLTKLDERFA